MPVEAFSSTFILVIFFERERDEKIRFVSLFKFSLTAQLESGSAKSLISIHVLLVTTHFINFNIHQPIHFFGELLSFYRTVFYSSALQKLKSFFMSSFFTSSLAVCIHSTERQQKESISFIINVFMCTFPLRFIYAVTWYEWNNLQVCQKNFFLFLSFCRKQWANINIHSVLWVDGSTKRRRNLHVTINF